MDSTQTEDVLASRNLLACSWVCSLLQLLLGSQLGGVTTCLLTAVGSPGVEPGVALPADHLVAVVLLGQQTQGGLDDSSTQTQHLVITIIRNQDYCVAKLTK